VVATKILIQEKHGPETKIERAVTFLCKKLGKQTKFIETKA
jgi:hypothetical protein